MRGFFSLCILFICGCYGQSEVEYAKPWDVGVNICAYWARPGIIDHKICSYCLPWKQKYGGKMMEFRYDCCPGFLRTKRFGNKCVERARTWKLIPGLLRDYGLNDFADYIVDPETGAGYKDINDSAVRSTYTVIAPYSSKVLTNKPLNYDSFRGYKEHPILFHVLKTRIYMRDMRNGMVLKTEFDNQKLKVTKYSNGMICIECRVLVEPDHEARNGVIHYFSGMLTPHKVGRINRQSITDLLDNDPNTNLFARSLSKKLRKILSAPESSKWYTVFAPNNEAWQKIIDKYGDGAQEIAANHVLRRGMYCSSAIISLVKKLGPTFAGQRLMADCDSTGQRKIRSGCGPWAKVVQMDMMANNGVVHRIDKALRPSKSLSMKEAMSNGCVKGNKNWMRGLRECDLRMQPNKKYAVLIPTDSAFKWWMRYKRFQKYYKRFQTDEEFRCRLIRFHIFEISGKKATNLEYLWLQQEGYRTNNIDRLWEVDYFLKMYFGSMLYFHYSPVDMFRSFQFEGGSFYFINRVNMIPEKNLIEILPTRSDFSVTTKFTKKAKMNQRVFKKNRPLNLYLVVRDGGYTPKLKKMLRSDDKNIRNFLLLHWVPLYLWGGDIGYFENGTRHRFMSGLGIELIFDRENNGTMYIGYKGMDQSKWAVVVEWNIFAIDGMIWVLDKPLICPEKFCKMKQKLLEVETWKVMTFACWEALKVRRGAKRAEMDIWLSAVQGSRCFTTLGIPKDEKSEHREG